MATLVEDDQKAPFFHSYKTEVYERALLLFLDCYNLPLIRTLYCWVLSKRYQVPFLKFLVWRDLGLNPGLKDHWRTLYPQDQWERIITLNFTKSETRSFIFDSDHLTACNGLSHLSIGQEISRLFFNIETFDIK